MLCWLRWHFNAERALEDAIDVTCRSPKIVVLVNSVGQQAADFSEETVRIDGRKMIASRQRCDLHAMGDHEAIRHRDKTTIRLACLCGNYRVEFRSIVNGC
jgi:hypothetical protein